MRSVTAVPVKAQGLARLIMASRGMAEGDRAGSRDNVVNRVENPKIHEIRR